MSELCSLCQVVEPGPYCPEHGRVHRPFSIGGRYEVDEMLGGRHGSFLFGARDHGDRRTVAVQVLRSRMTGPQIAEICEAQDRFLRTVASWGERPDEHAVGIVDFGWDEDLGVTYLVACRVGAPDRRPTLQEVEAALLCLDANVSANTNLWVMPAARAAEVLAAVADRDVLDDAELLGGPGVREPPEMIGSYQVVSALGSGGTGRVYLGQHPVIGSKVAIKVLLPEIAGSAETVERFIQEARASSQIGSPHIPRYFDFGTTSAGLPYAIMEYFDGETLGARLARAGTLSIAQTAEVVEQIASALQMAHDAGLIHRDLKPDNIFLVKPDGKTGRALSGRTASLGAGPDSLAPALEVKVLDFGIAKMLGNRSATRTLNGAFLGTPSHCAPEQVFGHEVDARTDVYSLGATAFQMLTGAPPFVGDVPEILSSKATEDPPDLDHSGVPGVVAFTIRHMLAREPQHRAPSMAWVLEQVACWPRAGEPGGAARARFVARKAAAAGPYTEPVVWSPRDAGDDATDPSVVAQADPAAATGEDRDPATTSQALRAIAGPHRRRRWRAALAITGGAIAVGALLVARGVPGLRGATPADPDAPAAPADHASARGVAPAAQVDLSAPSAPSTPAAPLAPPTVDVPSAGGPDDTHPGKPGDEPAAHGRAVARHPAAKPPADRKLPARRPAVKKPSPDEPRDVLIVDPFAPGTPSPRSDSP
jgi:serine/threonine-protein kinase